MLIFLLVVCCLVAFAAGIVYLVYRFRKRKKQRKAAVTKDEEIRIKTAVEQAKRDYQANQSEEHRQNLMRLLGGVPSGTNE